jgi:hypothetical protein
MGRDFVPAEFEMHLHADDEDLGKADEPDALDKFLSNARIAGAVGRHGNILVEGFHEERAPFRAEHAAIYKRIAQAAATETPLAKSADGWDEEIDTLHKRATGDASGGYRAWLQTRIALGKTASEAVSEWIRQFPHRRPEVEAALRAVAAEL